MSVNNAGTAAGTAFADEPIISGSGNVVAFRSSSGNLTSIGNPSGYYQVFARNRSVGTTTLVSVNAAGTSGGNNYSAYSSSPVISANGQIIAYDSYATSLVSGVTDTDGQRNIFARDLSNEDTTSSALPAAARPRATTIRPSRSSAPTAPGSPTRATPPTWSRASPTPIAPWTSSP